MPLRAWSRAHHPALRVVVGVSGPLEAAGLVHVAGHAIALNRGQAIEELANLQRTWGVYLGFPRVVPRAGRHGAGRPDTPTLTRVSTLPQAPPQADCKGDCQTPLHGTLGAKSSHRSDHGQAYVELR